MHVQDLLAATDIRQRDVDLAVEPAWAQCRSASRMSGRLVAADDHAEVGLKPSISTSIWFSVCSRSSLPPPSRRHAGDRPSISSMKMMQGRSSWRSRTCRARGRAHADEHLDEVRTGNAEERHLGLTGDGLGQQRLAGARRPPAAGRAECDRRASGTSAGSFKNPRPP